MRIDHVAIYGNNIEIMYFFYHEVLGFEETSRRFDENGKVRMIELQVGIKQRIEIFNFDSVSIEKKHEYVNRGYMHLGFASKNMKHIKERLLNYNQVIKEEGYGKDGLKHLWVEDPEKNLIEFTEK